jgi:membrane-bound lytic murein transglycosylase F
MIERFVRASLLIAFVVQAGSAHARVETVTDRYDDTFRKYTQRFFGPGYDWRIFKAQAMAESNISMNAKSWVGARGIMQLMPGTFQEIQSKNPQMVTIDQPEWNIAAGIYYDRQLWNQWSAGSGDPYRQRFMFASYNAGRATLLRAQRVARTSMLDPSVWPSIQSVAPKVPRWRYQETLGYVEKIDKHTAGMDKDGRVGR